ncbi:acyl-CoA dehydrogenase family protein [Micromonospora sp. NPDC049044]|uniref:acyl-CoA dehydrogenase family protein n=1 Tax=Micromonospora sp. NPDC049044 TaxID=3154827 RepID=UPI0033EAD050
MTSRLRAADIMDRPAGGAYRLTIDAEAEALRREAVSRFEGFLLDRANPGARFRNRACQPLDRRLFEEASEIGLLRFGLPKEIGGAGRDKFEWGVVITELARISRDPGFPVLLDITVENTEMILSSGRPELIDSYVPDLVAGRRFAVQGAYESRDPYDYQTTARFEDGHWVLNGAKRFIAGAVFADLFICYVRDEASNDMLAFAVERDDPGVTPVRLETMGMRTMGMGQLVLHDVRLPEWRLVWRSDALSELNTYARNRRTMSGCGVLGAIEGIVEACVESLSARRRGGRRVLDYPNVERSIGEMRMLLESARSTLYRALDGTRADQRDPYFDALATTAKHQVSEAAIRVGQLVMTLQGGESYISAFPWEQYMRDILGLIGGQGSQEMLLIQLGQRSIVGLEGRRLKQDVAERTVTRLADSWWAVSALAAREGAGAQRPEVSAAIDDVLLAAGLVGSPEGTDDRLTELTRQARAFEACATAVRTGLLAALLRSPTVAAAADQAGLATQSARELLSALGETQLVQPLPEDSYVVNPGLERLLVGGPRTAAFAARLRRAVDGGTGLRAGSVGGPDVRDAGRGDDAPLLADVFANELLGRLEGLEDLLDRPELRIGCAAGDGGRSMDALAREFPIAPVLAIEPDGVPVDEAGQTRHPLGRAPEVRVGDLDSFAPDDRLCLAWVPAVGCSHTHLERRVEAAARALVPGGWLVVVLPLPPKRKLGAAVLGLELALAGAQPVARGIVEDLLRGTGLGHIRWLWQDANLGVQLVASRRER